MPDRIGFIGLGIMGKPMAHNLLKAGFTVVVHNRHQEVTDEFVAAGASAGARRNIHPSPCLQNVDSKGSSWHTIDRKSQGVPFWARHRKLALHLRTTELVR